MLPYQQPFVIHHSQRLLRSFQHWTGRSLFAAANADEAAAQALFDAPFVLISHGTEPDPIFNYGNRQALELWQMDWQTFTQMPSRYAAEPIEQPDRDRLLAQVSAEGYIDEYSGIRISSTGQRFWVRNFTIWDVLDEQQQRCGQAATFTEWAFLPPNP